MSNEITVTHVAASCPTPTTTGVDHGIDLDVTVTLSDGSELEGEVTLVPAQDGRPEYEVYGPPGDGGAEYWVSSGLLDALAAACGDDTGRRFPDGLREISDAAVTAAGAP